MRPYLVDRPMAPSSVSDGLRETLDAFDGTAPGTPLTTTEVAEQLDVGRRSTYSRLERLAARDLVSTKKVGARGRVWWRPPAGSSGRAAAGAPAAELERVFDRIDDAVWALDQDWRFTYINERAEELLERSATELAGDVLWEALPWLEDQRAKEKLEEAMATGRTVHYEDYLEATDRWYGVRAYPSESGLSVYYQDITERKERERALAASERHNRVLVENFPNGVVTLFDEDIQHIVVGGQLFEALDVTVDEAAQRGLGDVFPSAVYEQIEPHYRAVFEGESREFEVELGDEVRLFRTQPVRDDDGEIVAGLGLSQDVTERRERERELELYETIVETVDDGVYALDEAGNFVLVNDAFCSIVGYDREELIGRPATTVHNDTIDRRAEQLASEIAAGDRELATEGVRLRTKGGEEVPVESRFGPYSRGDEYGRCGIVRDVTERLERERELERYVEIVDAVGEPVYELDAEGRFTFVNDAMVEYSCYSESELLGEHVSIGMDEEAVARAESHISSLLSDDEAVRTALEYEVATNDGGRIPVENRISVMTDEDGQFQGSAGLMWDISARKERERELERQRNRLKALDDLNGVVRGITEAVIDQSTRAEIERTVCDQLSETDSYHFACICDVDGQTETVNLRAEAGEDSYLDGTPISIDPDDEPGGGPTRRALIEREIQIARDIEAGTTNDPGRGEVEEDGSHSVAAIPISYEGTLFGVLNVYADRPDAFSADEQAVIGQLGEVVGHAIAAVDRKQALMSDDVVEIQFRIRDVFERLDVPAPAEGSIHFEQSVPIGEGAFLVYGTATGDGIDTVDTIVETGALAHWKSLSVLATEGGEARFELRMDEPPVISTVASHGGYVADARMADGDYHMRVHLAPGADVRQVVDTVKEIYPATTMVTRQQVNRGRPDGVGPAGASLESLTDRQRTAIETAYYAGYFEWPRDSSGGDVAGSLGIDPSTFHHHLRSAERKLLGSVLDADAEA